jgi:hypothetical protein
LSFSKKYVLKNYSNYVESEWNKYKDFDKNCYEGEIKKLYTFLDDNIEFKNDLIKKWFYQNWILLFDIIFLWKEIVRINKDISEEDENISSVEHEEILEDKKNIEIINNYINWDKLVIDDFPEDNNYFENIELKSLISFFKKEEYFFMTIILFWKLNKIEEKNEIEEYISNIFSENILLTELADNDILEDKEFLEKFNDYGEYNFSSNLWIRYLWWKYYLKASNEIYHEDTEFINFFLNRSKWLLDGEKNINFEIKEDKIFYLKNFIKFQDRIDNLYKKDFIKTLSIKKQNQLFKYLNELLEPWNFNESVFEWEYKNIYSKNKPDFTQNIDFDDVIKETKIEHDIYDFDNINISDNDNDKRYIFEALMVLYNKNYNDKDFIEDIKKDFYNWSNNISVVHLFSLYENVLSLYEKKVDDDTVYMWWLNSNKNINFWFKFFESIIEKRWKEKNIKIYVADKINWQQNRNKWLIKKYNSLWFELQKNSYWKNIIEEWWKNNRNSDFIMIRKKSA